MRMSRLLILIAVLGMLMATFAGPSFSDDGEERIVNKLKTTYMERISFTDEPLSNIMNYVSEFSGVNFVLSNTLTDEGIEIKALNLKKGMSVYQFLDVLAKLKELQFYYKDGIILVASKNDNVMTPFLRVYNINTLQFQTSDFKGPEIKLSSSDEGGFGTADVEYGADDDTPMTADDVAELIRAFTGGDTWDEVEGADIQVKGNLLLVYQIAPVHDQITALLQRLQDAN